VTEQHQPHEHEGEQRAHGTAVGIDVEDEPRERRPLGTALLVVGALLISGGLYLLLRPQASRSEAFARHQALQRALELRAAGQADEAFLLLEGAVAQYADDVPLRAELGWARLTRGDAAGAVQDLELAAKGDPTSPSVQTDLASAYLALGRGEEAVNAARRATTGAPNAAAGWMYLGRALILVGQKEEGLRAVQRVVELAPDDPGSASELAQAFLIAGRPQEARVQFERLCELLPSAWQPRVDLARLRLDLGDRTGALEALEQARALAPDEPKVAELARELGSG
jgi:Flp pilus assembly protein TadD